MNEASSGFVTPNSFYVFILANLLLIIICILLWTKVWLGTHQLYLPDGNFIPDDLKQLQPPGDSRHIYFSGCRQIFQLIRHIITEFDHEYIITNLGFEAFTYLAFLRRTTMLMAVFCILDICVWFPYLNFFQDPQRLSLITMESQGNANFRTTYSILVSAITLYFMYTFKKLLKYRLRYTMVKEVKEVSKSSRNSRSDLPVDSAYDYKQRSPMLNWLTLRTINVQIISNHNSSAAPFQIKQELQKYLNVQCQNRSRIADIVPIPDYGDLLNKHYDLEYYRTVKRMVEDERIPCLWSYFTYNSIESVEIKIKELQQTIEQERSKGVEYALGAFMVLDSMRGVRILCDTFDRSTRLRICRDRAYDQVMSECPYTFTVQTAQNSQDIVWSNMQYTRSGYLREIIINVLCVSILVFISTPATMLNTIKLQPVLTTLILLLTSSLLSFLLSLGVQQQKFIFQSKKQTREFLMQVFYLSMNMILVSIVRGIKNVTELFLMHGGWRWIEVFELVYKKVDGYFFCLLFMNQIASSFWISLIKPAQLFQNYGSASLFIYKSRINRNNSYGRNQNFQFGYNYALAITLFTITILFSCSIPLIHFFSLLFFLSRYYLDTYTLFTFHRQECQSLGTLVTRILFSVSVSVIIQLFLVANSLLIQTKYINAIVLYAVFAICVYIASHLSKPLVNDIDIVSDPEYQDVKIKKYHLDEWRALYTHPLQRWSLS